jgi:hypothetical protein
MTAFNNKLDEGSKTEWCTPPGIVRALGPFDLDPCAPITPPPSTCAPHFHGVGRWASSGLAWKSLFESPLRQEFIQLAWPIAQAWKRRGSNLRSHGHEILSGFCLDCRSNFLFQQAHHVLSRRWDFSSEEQWRSFRPSCLWQRERECPQRMSARDTT